MDQHSPSRRSIPLLMFLLALFARLLIIPLSFLRINPYSTSDAIGFTDAASQIAIRISQFQYPYGLPEHSSTYELWGTFLAPFWLLPGPSELYAHIFVAILGALAVYNVAVLGQGLHSRRSALLAALPLAVYPSIVLTHGVLLREAAILCCLTTVARVVISPGPNLSIRGRVGLGIGGLVVAILLRRENTPVYCFAILTGIAIWFIKSRWEIWIAIGITGLFSAIIASPYLQQGLYYLNTLRSYRSYGRTAYFGDILITSWSEAISYSWIGVAYFLFAPFPWMIETSADVVAAVEGTLNLVLFVAAIAGFLQIRDQWTPAVLALVGSFALGIVLYGFATVNVGTAVRHRPMFLWIIYLFAGIAFANYSYLIRTQAT